MLVMMFMVNRSATIINRFSMDLDGTTSMEKARGTTANCEMAEFGEKILFQPNDKVKQDEQAGREVALRALHGVSTGTHEIMVSGPDCNERALTVKKILRGQAMKCRRSNAREGIPVRHGV